MAEVKERIYFDADHAGEQVGISRRHFVRWIENLKLTPVVINNKHYFLQTHIDAVRNARAASSQPS